MMGKLTIKSDFSKPLASLKRLQHVMEQFGGAYVTVGVASDAGDYEGTTVSVAQVAFYNEYGTEDIPERSFLRATFIGEKARIEKIRDQAIENVITKGWTVEKALEMIGVNIVILIQNRMRAGIMPENAPAYLAQKIKKKQGSTPLIRLGSEKLIRSITYRVVING